MPTLDVALADYVKADATMLALVSGRVYPLLAPQQATLPLVVYQEITYRAEHHMTAVSGLAQTFWQWDVYAERHAKAREVALALTSLLDHRAGDVGGVDVRCILVRDRRTMLEDDEGASQMQYFRVSIDTEIWYLS
jgi:hypothetical protein